MYIVTKVYYSSDDEKYIVVKGHRRHAAMKNIIQEDGLDPTSVNLPCFKYGGIPEPEMILRDHIISN